MRIRAAEFQSERESRVRRFVMNKESLCSLLFAPCSEIKYDKATSPP